MCVYVYIYAHYCLPANLKCMWQAFRLMFWAALPEILSEARFLLSSPFGLLAAWTLGLLTGVLVSCLALSPVCRRSLGYLAQLLAWTLVPPVPARDFARVQARLREYRSQ